MKIGLLEISPILNSAQSGKDKYQGSESFMHALNIALDSNLEIDQSFPEPNPLDLVLAALTSEKNSLTEVEDSDFESESMIQFGDMIDPQFPNWQENVEGMMDIIQQITNAASNDQHLVMQENKDALIKLFIQLENVQNPVLNQMPAKEHADLLMATKEIQAFRNTVDISPSEIIKLEQLIVRLQAMENEERLKRVNDIFDVALSKEGKKTEQALRLLELPRLVPVTGRPVNKEEISSPLVNQQLSIGKLEESVLHVRDSGNNQETARREFLKEFSNILGRSHLSQTPNSTKLLIRLYPEQLGSLRIELLLRDGMMMARMMASTSMAKEMLDSQLHSLKLAFTQQNIPVDKIEVIYNEGELEKYTNQNGQDEANARGEAENPQKNTLGQEDDRDNFAEFLNDILFESEV